jgi:hypothetical protein
VFKRNFLSNFNNKIQIQLMAGLNVEFTGCSAMMMVRLATS